MQAGEGGGGDHTLKEFWLGQTNARARTCTRSQILVLAFFFGFFQAELQTAGREILIICFQLPRFENFMDLFFFGTYFYPLAFCFDAAVSSSSFLSAPDRQLCSDICFDRPPWLDDHPLNICDRSLGPFPVSLHRSVFPWDTPAYKSETPDLRQFRKSSRYPSDHLSHFHPWTLEKDLISGTELRGLSFTYEENKVLWIFFTRRLAGEPLENVCSNWLGHLFFLIRPLRVVSGAYLEFSVFLRAAWGPVAAWERKLDHCS